MGDSYYNNVPITRITAFETVEDNIYEAVHQIDLVGVFSFFAGNAFAKDFENDGTEELFICIDQHVIILNFTGKPNKYGYDIYYLKRNELADSNSVYYGATAYDLTNDNAAEILISLDHVIPQPQRIKTYTKIYRKNTRTSVESVGAESFDQMNATLYPNPFNSSAVINLRLKYEQHISIKVFDSIGQEILTLLNDYQTKGDYSISFDASNLSSGIYLIKIDAGKKTQTIKAMVLK